MTWSWTLSGISWQASPDRLNEDYFAVTDDLCVVLDGAGTPTGLDSGCRHGTHWYVAELGRGILDVSARDPSRELRDILSAAIVRVAQLHGGQCDLAHPGTPSSTVSIVRQVDGELEYLVLGDSPVLLAEPSRVRCIEDARTAAVERAAAARVPSAITMNSNAGRRAVVEYLRMQRNRIGGFWVADYDPRAAEYAFVGSVAVSAISGFAVMTDGVSRLVRVFGALSWGELIEAMQRRGLEDTLERLRTLEAQDPECRQWPRTKVCDDATVILGMTPNTTKGEARCNAGW